MRSNTEADSRGERKMRVAVTGAAGAYAVQASGADPEHAVENVTFENVSVGGAMLGPASPSVQFGPHVSGVHFQPPAAR